MQTDILIATDAIAMGLNLPIKTILFYKVTKYDGRTDRVLSPSEVQQIAGRAGRYNMQDVGYVGNMQFNGPFRAANIENMLEVAKIVDSYDLDIATKYHLSCAPLTLKSPYIVASFERYVSLIEQKMTIKYIPPGAREFRVLLNRYIEKSLQQSHFVPRCKICSKVLPLDSKYQICQSCFRKKYKRR